MKDGLSNIKKVFAPLGASNHSSSARQEDDFYATDPVAIEKLMEFETFSECIWECACGAGHLSKQLESNGYKVISTDLVYRGYGDGGIDFLAIDNHQTYDCDIVTNPPYKYALDFVKQALNLVSTGHKVAMFLRLQFLEGKERRAFFDEHPPKYIYVSSGRINCCKNADFSYQNRKKCSSAVAYAWFIWIKDDEKSQPIIRWFN